MAANVIAAVLLKTLLPFVPYKENREEQRRRTVTFVGSWNLDAVQRTQGTAPVNIPIKQISTNW